MATVPKSVDNRGRAPFDVHSPAVDESFCSYKRAGCISRILVLWLSPLLRRGYEKPLEMEDVPALDESFAANNLKNQLKTSWLHRRPEAVYSEWTLLRAIH